MDKLVRKTILGYFFTYIMIFILTILLLVPIYRMVYNSARNVIERNLTSGLSESLDRLANELVTLELYTASLVDSDEMVDMAYRPDINNMHIIRAIQLQERLCDPFISNSLLVGDIVILFKDSIYTVSKGIVQDRACYWGNTIYIDGMTQDGFEKALLVDRRGFLPQAIVRTKYMVRAEESICINYFSQTSSQIYYAISAIIPCSAIHEIMSEEIVDKYGWMRITDANGNVLYNNHIDDAEVRDEWTYTYTSAIMPIKLEAGVDNNVFASSVSSVQRTIIVYCLMAFVIVVILSVVMAFRLYMPIHEYVQFVNNQKWMNAETSMQSLRQCITESTRRFTINTETLQQKLNQMRAHYQNAVLLSLVDNASDVPTEQLVRCFGENPVFMGTYIVIRVYTGEHGGTAELDDMDRAYHYALEQVEKQFNTYSVTSPRCLMIASVNIDMMEQVDAKLEAICENIADMQTNKQTIVRLARSCPHCGLGELKAACNEVNMIVMNLQPFVREGKYLLCYEQHAEVSDAAMLSTFYPNSLYSVIMSGNQEAISEQMADLRKQFTALYLSRRNRASAFYYNIISVFELVRARLKTNIYICEYDVAWTVDETCDHLDSVAHKLGALAAERTKKPDSADIIINFLNEHYCDKDLCLSMLSTQFSLSEAYISRVIKLKTGYTYSEYVEIARMNRATELLKDTELGVSEIAAKLGYETPNTFFKAFKRVYRVSPGAYRDGINTPQDDKSGNVE